LQIREAFDVSEENCARMTDEEDGLAVYMSDHDKHARLEPLKLLSSASSWSHLDDIVPKYDGDTTVLRGFT
jgi:hypothetical protein